MIFNITSQKSAMEILELLRSFFEQTPLVFKYMPFFNNPFNLL